MSRNDPPRHRNIHDPEHAEAERVRDERIRDPYEAQRPVRSFGDDRPHAAAHPWDAAHGSAPDHFATDRAAVDNAGRPMRTSSPSWSEQPARYGGGYHGDDPRDGSRRSTSDPRASRPGWDDEHTDHYGRGQSNSGYDTRDADGERLRQQGDRPDHHSHGYGRSAGRVDSDRPLHGGGPGRGYLGAQDGRQDTYGSAGYQQQGKRYRFDESGDARGRAQSFRGVRPRNYVRSDERLRELINEQLTDADLDASDIEVTVEAGAVTLQGSVSQRWMKHQAEDIVDECSGVTDIHNQLRVRRPGQSDTSASYPPGQPAATTAPTAPTTTGQATTGQASPPAGASASASSDAATPPGETNRKH